MSSVFAVFVDADNIPARSMFKAMQLLKERGRMIICKVFGDFSRPELAPWKTVCLTYNLEAIMAWHKSGKNSSDLKICQACTHMLYSHPNIKDYVLVTGDGDFTTVIQDLKIHDKHVICMGIEEQCSLVLKNCCDEFLSLKIQTSRPSSPPNRSKKFQGIRAAIERQIRISDNGELNCGNLKEKLLREDPTFTEANYQQPSWVKLLQHLGYCVYRNSGGTPFCKKKK